MVTHHFNKPYQKRVDIYITLAKHASTQYRNGDYTAHYDSKLLWHRLYFLTSCFYSNTLRGTDVLVIHYNEHSDMYRHKMYFLIITLHIADEYKIEL